MPPTNSIQKALFAAINLKFRNQSEAIRDYLKHFPGCAESTARSRFNGTNSIDYDHGMQVARHYDLHDIDVWPQGWPDNHFFVVASSLQPDMDAYLKTLNKDLHYLQKVVDVKIHHSVSDMPFLLLKKYRTLAGFLLYYTFAVDYRDASLQDQSFGRAFLRQPRIHKWLDECKQALSAYQSIPGSEYWSPYMLNHMVAKLQVSRRRDYIDTEVWDTIRQDLFLLIKDMEETVATGQKKMGPNTEGAPVRILNHEGLLNTTAIAAQSPAMRFAYLEQGMLNIRRYSSQFADAQLHHILHYSDICTELGRRPLATTRFFDQLKYNVERLIEQPVS